VYNIYRCKNGLTDVAIPIRINDEHVGNFFIGQFLLSEPDEQFFAEQAKQFGFDNIIYMDALHKTPVFSERYIEKTVTYLLELTQLIGKLGLDKLQALEAEKTQKYDLQKQVQQRTCELEQANRKLAHNNAILSKLSHTDALTQLNNRFAFDLHIQKEWQRSVRSGSELSLLMIDIDHFKRYNDQYGHVAGDKCLVSVANIINNSVSRASDFAARYGGEEFVVVLADTPMSGALEIAKQIQDNIAAATIEHTTSGITQQLTLSIGLASLIPQHDNTWEQLVSLADKFLYQAKTAGRNTIYYSLSPQPECQNKPQHHRN